MHAGALEPDDLLELRLPRQAMQQVARATAKVQHAPGARGLEAM
jgi:hypothetical protein